LKAGLREKEDIPAKAGVTGEGVSVTPTLVGVLECNQFLKEFIIL
jgi:hypothetical protein